MIKLKVQVFYWCDWVREKVTSREATASKDITRHTKIRKIFCPGLQNRSKPILYQWLITPLIWSPEIKKNLSRLRVGIQSNQNLLSVYREYLKNWPLSLLGETFTIAHPWDRTRLTCTINLKANKD